MTHTTEEEFIANSFGIRNGIVYVIRACEREFMYVSKNSSNPKIYRLKKDEKYKDALDKIAVMEKL